MKLSVFIPRKPPGLNGPQGLIRNNRWALKRVKEEIYLLIFAGLPSRERIPGPVTVTCTTLYCRLPRDWDNAAAAAKYPMDAIVHAGVLDDDGPAVITSMTHKQTKVARRRQEGFRIEIETIAP